MFFRFSVRSHIPAMKSPRPPARPANKSLMQASTMKSAGPCCWRNWLRSVRRPRRRGRRWRRYRGIPRRFGTGVRDRLARAPPRECRLVRWGMRRRGRRRFQWSRPSSVAGRYRWRCRDMGGRLRLRSCQGNCLLIVSLPDALKASIGAGRAGASGGRRSSLRALVSRADSDDVSIRVASAGFIHAVPGPLGFRRRTR